MVGTASRLLVAFRGLFGQQHSYGQTQFLKPLLEQNQNYVNDCY